MRDLKEGEIYLQIKGVKLEMQPVIVNTVEEGKGIGDRYFHEFCAIVKRYKDYFLLMSWKDACSRGWHDTCSCLSQKERENRDEYQI